MVADAMVALGLIQRVGEHYQNTPVAATLLSGRTPTDARPILRQFNRPSYPRWAHLEEAVRTGAAVFGEFAFTPEEQQIYSEGGKLSPPAPPRPSPRSMTLPPPPKC